MISNTDIKAELARRELARRDLLQFTKLTYPNYQPGWVHEDICFRLKRFAENVKNKKSPRLLLLVPPRHGKMLSDDTLVYTKEGVYKTHGSLEVGDEILGLNGWVKVLAVSEPGECHWEVDTNAGVTIQCHENHEWLVYIWRMDKDRKYRYFAERVETNEFIKFKEKTGGMRYTKEYHRNRARYFLPSINVDNIPFEARSTFNMRKVPPKRAHPAIVDVRKLDKPKTGRCIQVDAPDGVYLVTRDFVPTHNSELASIRFPAWYLGHEPSHFFINVSYNNDLPIKFSRTIRTLLRDPLYQNIFPNARLDPSTQAVEEWLLTGGGGLITAGVGGGITGKGAHILTIDDPIKNLEEADSINTRQKLWDWYQSTAYTRLAPGGGVLWIETFWNDDDGAGRILQAMASFPEADQFEVVRYPAISEFFEYRHKDTYEIVRQETPATDKKFLNSHVLLRMPDEALHPDRYSLDMLKKVKANLQPRIWSALYQQNPVPDEGIFFTKDNFPVFSQTPDLKGCNIFMAWDFAITTKQSGDYNVGVVFLQDANDRWYFVDMIRFKGNMFEIIESIITTAIQWNSFKNSSFHAGFEDGQIWKSIKPALEQEMRKRGVFFSMEELVPLSDKQARARVLQGRMQQKRLFFPEDAPWKSTAVHELLRFPGGAHDDIVDAMAWCARLIVNHGVPYITSEVPRASWRDKLISRLNRSEGGYMSA